LFVSSFPLRVGRACVEVLTVKRGGLPVLSPGFRSGEVGTSHLATRFSFTGGQAQRVATPLHWVLR
jgi:hypothetical protein